MTVGPITVKLSFVAPSWALWIAAVATLLGLGSPAAWVIARCYCKAERVP